MTALTSERLAEIREWAYHRRDHAIIEPEIIDLLAHVDHLTAENARLRDGIEALADAHCLHDKYAYALLHGDDVRALLDPPTEGENEESDV